MQCDRFVNSEEGYPLFPIYILKARLITLERLMVGKLFKSMMMPPMIALKQIS